jgi:esterase/lipase
MIQKNLMIEHIPAILWGKKSDKLFIAVHGYMSNKSDDVISILAEEATALGYQIISFDLPEHGSRKDKSVEFNLQNCINDLKIIMNFAQSQANSISLFGCSIGAYFSLLAYNKFPIKQSLFLSPVVNMERIIKNMMNFSNISEERLKQEKEILTPSGQKLYWDYYCYVKENPIVDWDVPTSILYGQNDKTCEFDVISDFAKHFSCDLQIMKDGEHYFHTKEQLQYFRNWITKEIN